MPARSMAGLKQVLSCETPRERRMRCIQEVARGHMLGASDLLGRSQAPEVVIARRAAIVKLQEIFGDTANEIARLFDRHPASVRVATRAARAAEGNPSNAS